MQNKAFVENTLDVESWVAQRIALDGYAQIAVQDPAADRPGYAFTIGLGQSRQIPDLLCLGVAPDVSAQLFSLCLEAQALGTLDLTQAPLDTCDLVDGFTLRLQPVPAAMREHANDLRPSNQPEIAEMVQLVLPDNTGHFPGDPACDPRIAAAQDTDWLLAQVQN